MHRIKGALRIAEAPGEGIVGDNAAANFIGDENRRPRKRRGERQRLLDKAPVGAVILGGRLSAPRKADVQPTREHEGVRPAVAPRGPIHP